MISVILPTYNSIEFIEERVLTIINQTIEDWECLVIDGESIDGTWEYLNRIALTDARFKMFQFPPKGVYNAWNIGVRKSEGEYIYFATSDDTMKLNCLEEFLKAFELAPTCNIAHSCLNIIDENSEPIENLNWRSFPAQQYFGELTEKYHIRRAPLSGILYATHQTIIHSFTQVLIKKNVFDTCGLFLENQGSTADLEWGMRIGLTESIIHVPLELATWRVHENQLTTQVINFKSKYKLLKLMDLAIENSKCDQEIKQKKNLILGFSLHQLFLNMSFLEKVVRIHFLRLTRFRLLNKNFTKSLVSRRKYQLFLQKKLKMIDKKLIELI
jgi:glycosyltransferase involved in cell wall biosynthesis